MKTPKMLAVLLLFTAQALASGDYWQQRVDYQINIDFDAAKSQFKGEQKLTYTNFSPDTLRRVYYHLYFNAFQPGSSMDVRSRNIVDPDPRIGDRIGNLNPEEIGYHRILSLKQDGQKVSYQVDGTVLIVLLNKPLLPKESSQFQMTFESQVPVQIRRSGRLNEEGVEFTMTQWYPKMAEYDRDGWHTDPYVGREFHGVFGTFDVHINLDSAYTVGGTGVVQNPNEVGHGYGSNKLNEPKINWHFKAENVHDFAWAADKNFNHTQAKTSNGTVLHFIYKTDSAIAANWKNLVPKTVELFHIMNDRFGVYPYPQFSVIQAGDGGMEYPMCTMISGTGNLGSLLSVTVHEAIHNWYYGVLASNELKYPWMDEGFTTFAQNVVLDSIYRKRSPNPHARSFRGYVNHSINRTEEPLTTHADHYETNAAYGNAAYSKGCVFLAQLQHIIGETAFDLGMQRYFNAWKFKHPTPTDFKRIMEETSGIELDWYFEGWIGTSKQVDYSIRQIVSDQGKTTVLIESIGNMHLPLEITVKTFQHTNTYYVPVQVMRAEKQIPKSPLWISCKPWDWTYPFYELSLPFPLQNIQSIVIDLDGFTADVDRANNEYPMADKSSINPSK